MSILEESLARRLAELRKARNWSLEELSLASGISRATLSRIERGETSPTADVLGKLASAFGISMAELFAGSTHPVDRYTPRKQQLVWQDPETGFQRRALIPAAGGYRASVIEGTLPAGALISYAAPPLPDLEHHLVLLEGELRCTIGPDVYDLEQGDTLRFRLNVSNSYQASGDKPARYILTVITP